MSSTVIHGFKSLKFAALHFLSSIAEVIESGIKMYNEGGASKILLVVISSSIFVPVSDLFNQYVFSDWQFLAFVLVLLTLDLISGVIKASGIWDFTGRAANVLNPRIFIIKLMEKIFVCIVWLILTHFVQVYAEQKSEFASSYSLYFGNGVLAAWLLWSISANLFVITKGQFPPIGLIKRLAAVNKSGNVADFQDTPTITPEEEKAINS